MKALYRWIFFASKRTDITKCNSTYRCKSAKNKASFLVNSMTFRTQSVSKQKNWDSSSKFRKCALDKTNIFSGDNRDKNLSIPYNYLDLNQQFRQHNTQNTFLQECILGELFEINQALLFKSLAKQMRLCWGKN